MMAASLTSAEKNLRVGLTLAFTAAFLFSTKPIIIKWLYSLGMSALPLMGLRMLVAFPVYLIIGFYLWNRMESKPSGTNLLRASAVGLLGYYLASLLDLSGLEYVSAQLERLMLYAYPSMVIIIGALFFGAKVSRSVIPALLLTYAGLGVMYG
ncbi:MAG: DMT family transporter, partial [Pseudomonadota bacterium]|nr:DMT family transporter [Pseudomonadota bacterium]